MELSDRQRRTIEQVINAFETGSVSGDYANISVYADGPNNVRQITYGRSQTTEFGKLRDLIAMYIDGGGQFADRLRPFLEQLGQQPLADDDELKQLLQRAATEDPLMRSAQDRFFEQFYLRPALGWADQNGFVLPLSGLVVYDSFIHSGSILDLLRQRFDTLPPATGGDEQRWIADYVAARHDWLANHSRLILRKTIYRTECLRREIDRGNWSLEQLPILANDVVVSGD
jgi:chitosanase